MADTTEDSVKAEPVKIVVEAAQVDSSTPDDLVNSKSEISDDSSSSALGSEINSKSNCVKPKESVLRPSLFLRPSALSGDSLRWGSSTSTTNTTSSSALKINANNKFAVPDSTADSIFDVDSKEDKKESNEAKATLLPSISIPAPSPLSNPDYVFGQNMLSRVSDHVDSTSNGTGSSMLFSAALSAENGSESTKDEQPCEVKESSSLLEDAARCQEQRTNKRKYEEVMVSTGEENEINVIQIVVKLFAFEGGSWVERGRGTLRLNDAIGGVEAGSRIVVRTLGSLRVVLNTKIWPGMEFERANEKNIRTTALDASGQLKIFLIQGSPTDVTSLQSCMEYRLRRCRELNKSETSEKPDKDIDTKEEEIEEIRPVKVPALEAAAS